MGKTIYWDIIDPGHVFFQYGTMSWLRGKGSQLVFSGRTKVKLPIGVLVPEIIEKIAQQSGSRRAVVVMRQLVRMGIMDRFNEQGMSQLF